MAACTLAMREEGEGGDGFWGRSFFFSPEVLLEKFVIEGGVPLCGRVTPSGNKNAALPIIAASLLTDEPLTLKNVPRIRDVQDMLAVLAEIGVEIFESDPPPPGEPARRTDAGTRGAHTLTLRTANLRSSRRNAALGAQIRASILFAGPLSGVEGYTESIATGMLAGHYAAALTQGRESIPVPRETALGSLVHYITHADAKSFQPANITFDLLVPLEEELRKKIRDKKERHRIQCERALQAFDSWHVGD